MLKATCQQSNCPSQSTAIDELDATLEIVEQLKRSPGHYLFAFISEFDNSNDHAMFCEPDVSRRKRAFDIAKQNSEALTQGTLTYLEKQFVLGSFSIE